IHEEQSRQKTTEYLLTERFNWPVSLMYTGDDASGRITLDLTLNEDSDLGLRITKTVCESASQVTYHLALLVKQQAFSLRKLVLIADADVINSANAHPQYAVNGLDLVQAALVVSEPAFETNAEALLFPALPAATKELVIRAVCDWVAFTRRRENQ